MAAMGLGRGVFQVCLKDGCEISWESENNGSS
jgi:hypothetical protein